jgi:hypothetical protein
MMSKMKLALDVVQDLRNLADSIEALANAAVGDGTPEQPVSNTPPSTDEPGTPPAVSPEKPLGLVELRAFVAEHSTSENRPKIKALLGKHGVAKLTELPENQYEALKREVAAL